jgi:hypothetical protein
MQPIPRTLGKLTKGNFLLTNWNSAGGVAGADGGGGGRQGGGPTGRSAT